ncbi:MAG: anti-anti-sigma regulatory factor [Gammaproteobacteria bacterium]|jgi:anti-anti-sigma regulatory factor
MNTDIPTVRKQRRTVKLSGVTGVANTEEIHAALAPLLARKGKVSLDLGAVERTDTAVLQLLLAFRKAAAARNCPVVWLKLSESVIDTSQRLGLFESLGFEACAD